MYAACPLDFERRATNTSSRFVELYCIYVGKLLKEGGLGRGRDAMLVAWRSLKTYFLGLLDIGMYLAPHPL